MNHSFHVEINCQQQNHWEGRICGDVFITNLVKEENRITFAIQILANPKKLSLNSKLFKSIKSSVVISDTDIEDTIRFKKKIKPLLLDTTGSSHYGVFCACGYCKWYGIDESTAYSIISKYVTVDKLDEIISNIWSKL